MSASPPEPVSLIPCPSEVEIPMKPHILQLNPILVPSINARLDERYTMHRLFEQADADAYLAEHGALMRGVITGGHTGISRAMMEKLPALAVVAVNAPRRPWRSVIAVPVAGVRLWWRAKSWR